MEPDSSCSCETCARLRRECELYERLIAAADAQTQALDELLRLQDARIADLERRLRTPVKRQR